MKRLVAFLIFFLPQSLSLRAESAGDEPMRWAVGFNVTETAGFVIGKYVVDWPVTFIPIHLDGSYSFNEHWGLGFGLVYRYENYHDKNPLNKSAIRALWTNYHEFFLLAGPKYSFFGEHNRGLYGALKAGPGFAFSPGGYALSVVAQPELGYSFLFGEDLAFQLDLAAGLLLNLPVMEDPRLGFSLFPIGWLVHRTVPILRLGIGLAF
ncbi:MAG TPA: hypothetical protein VEL47_00345 [Myxococcota bacterium]|nr:hypothetical protein [Myxococcota bacterium]